MQVFRAVLVTLCLFAVASVETARAQFTSVNIANGDIAGLKAALNTANSDGGNNIINLATNGTYTLTAVDNSTNGPNGLPVIGADNGHVVIIHGNGATLTRSGSAVAFRILQTAAGSNLAIDRLTVSNGSVANLFFGNSYGGAIYDNGGVLTLATCTFNANTVKGPKGGDGISTERNGSNGEDAVGGAIDCISGTLTVTGCAFNNNTVTGGDGGKGYTGSGGGNGGNGGFAVGGAINANAAQASVISRCTFTTNAVGNGAPGVGIGGGATGTSGVCGGGAIWVPGELPVTVNLCTFSGNSALGHTVDSTHVYPGLGGAVAVAQVLAVSEPSLHVTESDFSSNRADEGGAVVGAIFTGCSFESNSATVEGGAAAAFLYGGSFGIYPSQQTSLISCTFYQNIAPYGGAFYGNRPTVSLLTNCTFVSNTATTAGGSVSGGTLTNDLFKGGSPSNFDASGSFVSNGHNLSDDAAGGDASSVPGGFLNKTGDLRNTNPQILTTTPQSNGGPTKTFAIGVFGSSPAINAGDDSYAPRRDQRGYFRAGRSDIGAYEYFGGLVGGITIARSGNDVLVSAEMIYGTTYRLQRKTSLTDSTWQDIPGVNDLTASDNDTESITDPGALGLLGRAFYRVTFEN